MKRRSVLLGIAVVSGGCLGNGNTPDKKHRESFMSHLESADVEIVSVEQSETDVNLQYVPKGSQYQELSAEIGAISGGFVREVENGWSVNRLNAEIVSEDTETIARWHIKSTWIEKYRNKEITPNQLTLRIIETVEFTNGTS